MSTDRPNILVFFTDQQRADTCGCYGQPMDVTPNLDRMAAEGVRFERAFSPQPLCGPARAILQTGLWPTDVGMHRNGLTLDRHVKTVAHYLRDVGYQAGYIGKWHLASGAGARADGPDPHAVTAPYRGGYVDHWLAADALEHTSHGVDGHLFDADNKRVDFTGYRVDALTDFAIDFIEGRDAERPFLLYLSYLEPHHQNDRDTYEGPEGSAERFADFEVPPDLEGTDGDWRENYPDYLGCCHALDAGLGRIRETLEAEGIAEETLIVYVSDHGSHFRTRNAEYKRSCHEASIRVPLVAAGPGLAGGRVVDEMVTLMDVVPTVLTAAGAGVPEAMPGRSLQALAAGGDVEWRDDVYIQISESEVGRALRTDRWKYGVRAPEADPRGDAVAGTYVEEYLYDLKADPWERDNLVRDPATAEVRAELRARLARRIGEVDGVEATIEPAPEG